jgi:SET family sugar efflux transporter-like MFS transporter
VAGDTETKRLTEAGRGAGTGGLSAAWEAAPLAGAVGAYGVLSAFITTSTSLFLASAVHAAPLLIGVFFAVRGGVSLLVNQAAGPLSDRLPDRRLLLLVAGAGGAIGGLCFAVLRDYVLVLVFGTLFFAVGSLSFSQLFAYANELAHARSWPVTQFTSLLRSVFSAAWIIGPPAGLFLLGRYGFGPLFLDVGGLSLLTGVLGWCLRRLPAAQAGAGPAGPPGPAGAPRGAPAPGAGRRARAAVFPKLPRRTWLLLGAVAAIGVVNQMYTIDVPLYVTRTLHLNMQLVGWMAGLGAALEIPVMIVAGRLSERVGKQRLLLAAAVGAAAFFCLLPLARSAALLLALQLLNAAWVAVAMSIPMVAIQEETPGGAGEGSALYSSAFMSAGLLAGAVTGVTAALAGYGGVFWVCAVIAAAAAVMLLARNRSRPGSAAAQAERGEGQQVYVDEGRRGGGYGVAER